MKGSRTPLRTDARRFGNVSLIALMLLSLCILSLIRARFAPYGNGGFHFISFNSFPFSHFHSHTLLHIWPLYLIKELFQIHAAKTDKEIDTAADELKPTFKRLTVEQPKETQTGIFPLKFSTFN